MNRRNALFCFGLIPAAIIEANSTIAWAAGTELAVVVDKNSPVGGLSFHELKQLFKGERMKDPAGTWVVPINCVMGSSERTLFDDVVLGMSPDVVRSYWIDRKIRGQSGAPKELPNPSIIQAMLGKVPGSISYVNARDVVKSVKVVKIDGHLPGEAGYSLTS
jgi:ABC-type phosphate transport system substrate-binding protein